MEVPAWPAKPEDAILFPEPTGGAAGAHHQALLQELHASLSCEPRASKTLPPPTTTIIINE